MSWHKKLKKSDLRGRRESWEWGASDARHTVCSKLVVKVCEEKLLKGRLFRTHRY